MNAKISPAGISRRKLIIAAVGAAPLLALSATGARAKTAQTAAGYTPSSNSAKHCGVCNYFIAPNSCKIVDGTVNANGVCNLFAKKS